MELFGPNSSRLSKLSSLKNSEAKTQASRGMYIQIILDMHLDDGGWTFIKEISLDQQIQIL